MDAQAFQTSNFNFALQLFKKLSNQNNESNVFISPLSVSIALAAVYLGSNDNTKHELQQLLNCEKVPDELLHDNFKNLLEEITKPGENILLTATSILAKHDLPLTEEYKRIVTEKYKAKLERVDFSTNAVKITENVNNWVKDQTNGKIEKLLGESLDSDTAALIVNATYFRGLWMNQFDEEITREGEFYNQGKTPVAIQMMFQDDRFRVAFDQESQIKAVELCYKDPQISMLILLPEERTGLLELENKLSPEFYQKIDAKLSSMRIMLHLPKFKLEFEKSLNASLKSLGIIDLFDKNKADLSNMSLGGGLFVSDVIHKSVLEVDEIGSEAAAATAIKIMLMSLPPSITVDHPFLFVIRNTKLNTVLFIGKVWEL